jgi:hypothetical protein
MTTPLFKKRVIFPLTNAIFFFFYTARGKEVKKDEIKSPFRDNRLLRRWFRNNKRSNGLCR